MNGMPRHILRWNGEMTAPESYLSRKLGNSKISYSSTRAFLAGMICMLVLQNSLHIGTIHLQIDNRNRHDVTASTGRPVKHPSHSSRSLRLQSENIEDSSNLSSRYSLDQAYATMARENGSTGELQSGYRTNVVNRTAFLQHFSTGYANSEITNEVLLLHERIHEANTAPDNALEATAHCKEMLIAVMPIDKGYQRHCLAIVPDTSPAHHLVQWERKWHKLSEPLKPSSTAPVSSLPPPTMEHTKQANQALQQYLTALPASLETLRPIAKRISANGPLMIMVVNAGQLDFFVNFVCSARARHIDLSRLLLFATDLTSHQGAQQLNVTSFHDETIFGAMPEDAAQHYKDQNYARIMMSKVYCVHMINRLHHDFLFLDVEITLFRDPVPFFANLIRHQTAGVGGAFDMYYQHDGDANDARFWPLQANTGFYYVRNNAKTRYLYDTFVRNGDLVLATGSHQAAFHLLANEHISTRGLRVQVLRDEFADLFPTGYHYHRHTQVVQRLRWLTVHNALNGQRAPSGLPYLFHANWLQGSETKRWAMQFLGSWFVNDDDCGDGETFCCRAQSMSTASIQQKYPDERNITAAQV